MSTCGRQSAFCGCSGESALSAAEEATAEADNQAPRSEPMEALVAEGKAMLEQG
jgi:hypothetical protein